MKRSPWARVKVHGDPCTGLFPNIIWFPKHSQDSSLSSESGVRPDTIGLNPPNTHTYPYSSQDLLLLTTFSNIVAAVIDLVERVTQNSEDPSLLEEGVAMMQHAPFVPVCSYFSPVMW